MTPDFADGRGSVPLPEDPTGPFSVFVTSDVGMPDGPVLCDSLSGAAATAGS